MLKLLHRYRLAGSNASRHLPDTTVENGQPHPTSSNPNLRAMNISRPSSLPAALLLVLFLATGCQEEPDWANVHTVVPMVAERHEPHGLGPRLPLERQVALAAPDNILEPDPALAVAPPAEGGTLRRGLRSWLPSRYTWMTENLVSVSEINSYVNEGIARPHVNAPDRWAPGLAERVTVSDDGRVYRIYLEQGVLWPEPFSPFLSDVGEKVVEVTSEDFAFAFQMMRDPRVERAGPARSWYSDCTDLRVLDPYTFEMVWSEPGLAARIWTLSFTPLPKHIFSRAEDGTRYRDPAAHLETHWHRWPMGAGPYRASSIIDDQMIRLERNPRYHGATPPIENIEFSAYTRASELFADLRSDRLDVVQIPSWFAGEEVGGRTLIELASSMDGIHVLDVKQLGYSHIGWNLRHGPTRHVEVRQALTMALDRERIIDEVYGGRGNVSTGPYSSMTPYASPEIEPLPFDLQAARRLLEENGWGSVRGVREKRTDLGRERLELELLVQVPGSPVSQWGADFAGVCARDVPYTGSWKLQRQAARS